MNYKQLRQALVASISIAAVMLFFVHIFSPASRRVALAVRDALDRAEVVIATVSIADATGSSASQNSSAPTSTDTTAPTGEEAKPANVGTTPPVASRYAADYAQLPHTNGVRSRRIGIFVSDSPIDRSSLARLNTYAGLGVDTVFNYSILDGSASDVTNYLNKAQSLGIQVIFSLKDLYDPLGVSNFSTLYSYPIGDSNQSAAVNAVRQFGSHPAVWGFAISDERPESPDDLSTWQSIMQQRYSLIKQNTNKPVMMVLVGATSPSATVRQQFLRSLRSSTDTFALDYYPIPFQPASFVASIGQDLAAVGDADGWFVAQAFSWASYPSTARGLGFDASASRLPTSSEMSGMAALALNNGARNVLFYSYFDIAGNATQLNALRQAIGVLRN